MRNFRTTAKCAVGIMLLGDVLIGCGTGRAFAEPAADKSRSLVTEDGWTLTLVKNSESITRYPDLASSAFSKEAFVSVKAVADITGAGSTAITGGSLTVGYQIGCKIDVSGGITPGLAASVGPTVSVAIGSASGFTAGLNASVTPSITATLKPGTITSIPLATKPLTADHVSITLDEVELKVDSCMGGVSVRSFAAASISTVTADSSTSVYGDPAVL
ncbi:MspA family porin [Nocardia brasiliensis]